jgi:hypothetical protein
MQRGDKCVLPWSGNYHLHLGGAVAEGLVLFDSQPAAAMRERAINCDLRVVIAGFTWVSGDIAL